MLELLLEEAEKIADSRNGEVLQGVLKRLAEPPKLIYRLAPSKTSYFEHWQPTKINRKFWFARAGPVEALTSYIDCMHCFYKIQFEDKQIELRLLKEWLAEITPGDADLSDYWHERQSLELSLGNSRHVMERDKCKCGGEEYGRLRRNSGHAKPILVRSGGGCIICRELKHAPP